MSEIREISIEDRGGELIIDRLTECGYEAYFVGGCIRNTILCVPISDYDITTSAPPDEVKKIFSDSYVLDTGLKHGTVSVYSCGSFYEITTFRYDGKYSDNRHPDNVLFCSDLCEDLKRRDFTCNAMAFSKKQGLIDNFNGYNDTRNRLIRAVGEPVLRFKEDSLRILRGLRFCSEFGFDCEKKTAEAMKTCRLLISGLSKERIYSELLKIFAGKYLYKSVSGFADVLSVALNVECLSGDLYDRALRLADRVEASAKVRFAAFMYIYLNKKVTSLNDMLCGLKVDRYFYALCRTLFGQAAVFENTCTIERYTAKKFLSNLGEFKSDFLAFLAAFTAESAEMTDKCLKLTNFIRSIEDNGECYKISTLAADGNDMRAEGLSGKKIGVMLSLVLEEVMRGTLDNDKDDILSFVRSHKD